MDITFLSQLIYSSSLFYFMGYLANTIVRAFRSFITVMVGAAIMFTLILLLVRYMKK